MAKVKTLAELWRASKAAVLAISGESVSVTMRFTPESVFIGDREFKITSNRSNGREYRQVRINVEELLRLANA